MSKWCDNCGLCCMHMRSPPFTPLDPYWKTLPTHLQEQVRDFVMRPSPLYDLMVRYSGKINPCLWLDLVTGKCRHYELRPGICRNYLVGSDPCRTLRKEVGLTIKGMPMIREAVSK